jgi:pimeloyl-ACP methyl ester carboxylesterase
MSIRLAEFYTGNATLHYAEAGDPRRPLLICLHGFPEYWAGWRGVMRELAADFHVVAPNQRGYDRSSKPAGIEAYRARYLVGDIAALADHLSPERPFILAGHDWGASVAYAYAFAHPHRLTHLVIANGVHPACFQRAIFEDPDQSRASQYINKLRAPDAEDRLSANRYEKLFGMLSKFSATDWLTDEERAGYLAAWSEPGALTGMLNWYRASPVVVPAPGEAPTHAPILDIPEDALTVRMPHLLLWGEADTALRPSCIADLACYAPRLETRRFPGSGHWILHERPAEIAAAIRAFAEASSER